MNVGPRIVANCHWFNFPVATDPFILVPAQVGGTATKDKQQTAQQKPPLPSYPGQRHIGNSYYLPEPYSIYKHDAESLDRMNVKRLQIVL